jgi:DMSO/TMAO reductase YedYZ molybdopterin-dependent catalytic subunit
MTRRLGVWLALGLLVAMAVSACGGTGAGGDKAGVPSDAALKITGSVNNEVGWTEGDLQGMTTRDAEYTNKDGVTSTSTGVTINSLLERAGVASGATTVVFVAGDGFENELPLAEVQACADCIVAFGDGGELNLVMPGFSSRAQVKGVVEIKVQ